MESAGLSLFFVGLVMHVMDTDIVLILMNALFIIPVISQFGREFKALSDEAEMELSQNLFKKRRKIHIMNVVLSSIAFIFQTIGIIGLLYLVSIPQTIKGGDSTIVYIRHYSNYLTLYCSILASPAQALALLYLASIQQLCRMYQIQY